MKHRILSALVILCMCCVAFMNVPVLALEDNTASSNESVERAYRVDLLVSFYEYWYTDGAGVTSHVEYGHEYRSFNVVNGYRVKNYDVELLPITGEFPPNTTQLQKVTISYEFY
ncbi:hypothetical protein [Allofournierella massiliensis]|uniref:Uncharacterized protein n=1 Tax=Allofournierella massiliensis TaxID=1650663 RepID=A0ABT7URH8_9FIRM|nr:hypothetical protein [Fournierella massiliensis]MDM8201493.1 hypothetical protein [Fournierella massiliensis]